MAEINERESDIAIEIENEVNEINEDEITEGFTSSMQSGALINDWYGVGGSTEAVDMLLMKSFKWNHLHLAASRGEKTLFQHLWNPELADALDSQQRSLLHLASANGHFKIVKALVEVRPEMCLARDRDGANPLHVAAMRGKFKVFEVLFKANPHAARARVDSRERETILHLCVKYNQLQFLSILLSTYFKGEEFVNAKDNDDNTILHLAVAGRRFEMIDKILTLSKIDRNAMNASKQTAMDILLGQKKETELDGEDGNIQALLQLHHAKGARDGILNPSEIAERRNGIIVAVVLMATLAFQVGVAPPAGVWQNDSDGHTSGKAVMASNYPLLYLFFLCSNLVGFISSVGTLILIMTDLPFKPGRYLLWTSITKITTITSIAVSYLISLYVVSPLRKQKRRIMSRFGLIEGIIFLTVAVLFILFLIAIIVAKRKRRRRAVEKVNKRRRRGKRRWRVLRCLVPFCLRGDQADSGWLEERRRRAAERVIESGIEMVHSPVEVRVPQGRVWGSGLSI